VVDDEPAIRLLCRVNLELEGFEVAEAGTVAAARERLAEGGIAVVLLDMHIGIEHGMSLLEELLAAQPRVPVAVVSGSTDLDTGEYARADAILAKPFTIEQLTGVVHGLAAS
jgi:two-component system response regulator PilR (NtrC family)